MISVKREYVEIRTSRSSGSGGQSVNKTESRVEIRFHIEGAFWLSEYVKKRLRNIYPTRINKADEFVIVCETHKSQNQNLEEAIERLEALLVVAAHVPKNRVKTKPTRSSKERRLNSKKMRSEHKKNRRVRE